MKKIIVACSILMVVFIIGFIYTTMFSNAQNDDKKEISLTKEENSTVNHTEHTFKTEKEYAEYVKQLDCEIAKSFDINLDEYSIVEDFSENSDSTDTKISLVYKYITKNNLERGDKKPSVYLKNDNNNDGLILYQKANKINKVFLIRLDNDITYDNPENGIIKELSK